MTAPASMRLTAQPLDLTFARPFGISRWTRTGAANVLVELEADGVVGRGEGAPNARYGETQADTLSCLSEIVVLPPRERKAVVAGIEAIRPQTEGRMSARAAVDAALWDWYGRQTGRPVWDLLGLPEPRPQLTSYTIGIDSPDVIREKVREAEGMRVLKIKLGTDDDVAIVQAVRSVTELPLRVDANEGWADPDEAIRRIEWLAAQGVELVEQPIPAGRLDDVAWVRERSPLPLVADEDCGSLADVDGLAGVYDGINIKLDKSGGLLEATRMIASAQRLGVRIMLGCMVSSSLSTSTAMHLAGAAEWLDLDGHLLLASDPFVGVGLEEGRLIPTDGPGLGVEPRDH